MSHRRSGGCLYNTSVAEADDSLMQITCDSLEELLALPQDRILLDTLWIDREPADRWLEAARATPDRFWLLAHYFPPDNPLIPTDVWGSWLRNCRKWLPILRGVVTVGARAKRSWQAVAPDLPVYVVQPAVPEVGGHCPPESGPSQIITVGSLSPAKFPLDTLDHIRRLEGLDWRWQIFGIWNTGDPHWGAVRARVARHNIGSRLDFIGHRTHSDVLGALRNAHVYVGPSLFESFGMATAEAFSVGTPSLVFDVGEVNQWRRPGDPHRVFGVGDWDGMFGTLHSWLDHGRKRLPAGSCPPIFDRDWRQVAEKLIASIS
jgi:glycosyltransferase involved in cell wall biosynthesis